MQKRECQCDTQNECGLIEYMFFALHLHECNLKQQAKTMNELKKELEAALISVCELAAKAAKTNIGLAPMLADLGKAVARVNPTLAQQMRKKMGIASISAPKFNTKPPDRVPTAPARKIADPFTKHRRGESKDKPLPNPFDTMGEDAAPVDPDNSEQGSKAGQSSETEFEALKAKAKQLGISLKGKLTVPRLVDAIAQHEKKGA